MPTLVLMLRPAPRGRFDRRLLVPMMLGAALNPLNSAILSVALAPIGLALGAPTSEVAWLVSSLYLTSAIGQPLVGRLVDIFGPRPLSLIGAGLAIVSGIIGIFAPNVWVLVLARVILGLGTCAGYPAAMHLIRSEGRRTGIEQPATIISALAIVTQTIIVIGPTIGGLLVQFGGWRSTFVLNAPLGLVTLVLCWIIMPKRTGLEPPVGSRPRLDGLGIVLFSVMLCALLLFLMNIRLEQKFQRALFEFFAR